MTDPEAVENGPRTNSMAPTQTEADRLERRRLRDEDAAKRPRPIGVEGIEDIGAAALAQAEKAESDAARRAQVAAISARRSAVAQLLEFAAISGAKPTTEELAAATTGDTTKLATKAAQVAELSAAGCNGDARNLARQSAFELLDEGVVGRDDPPPPEITDPAELAARVWRR